jgi:hypothetical protein
MLSCANVLDEDLSGLAAASNSSRSDEVGKRAVTAVFDPQHKCELLALSHKYEAEQSDGEQKESKQSARASWVAGS